MEIGTETKRQIEEIISTIECQKDFECYKSGFQNLTKVKSFEPQDLVECLGENPQQCQFSFPFGNGYFCKCPVRAYIAQKLGK